MVWYGEIETNTADVKRRRVFLYTRSPIIDVVMLGSDHALGILEFDTEPFPFGS
jgi:hypothetical protein